MRKFHSYFRMEPADAKRYAVEALGYFQPQDAVSCAEIGDGNINYVFRVWGADGRSLVLKQADRLLRSSGRPLDQSRSKIEAMALEIQGALAPGCVPKVYHYDETMAVIAMEDVSVYSSLRQELMAGRVYPHLSETLSTFLADTLLPTTDLVLARREKRERAARFFNPELCDITEDLVLTEPYYNYKNRNVMCPENQALFEALLYQDEVLHGEIAALRCGFVNHAQALLHGDLHTGSIFANPQGVKIIDPEFACYGPMGYDIGNVLGNLCFAWAYQAFAGPAGAGAAAALEETVCRFCDRTAEKLAAKHDGLATLPLYRAPSFRRDYLAGAMADAYGYAGTEIIRRVVGDSKVAELTAVTDAACRAAMERVLVRLGLWLIGARRSSLDGAAVTAAFRRMLGEEAGQ